MKDKFYSTPGLVNPVVQKVERTGHALVDLLEYNYAEWRADVENRLCPDDPKVHAKFKADIAMAKKQIT